MSSIFSIRNLTLRDMIRSEEYQAYETDRLGNYLAFSNPKLYGRIMEYADNGADGRTHRDIIECWKAFLRLVLHKLPDKIYFKLEAEILKTEEWHIQNESIDRIIG